MKGKIVCKSKGIFFKYIDICQNFDTNWTRHKSVFQFHLILILIIRCQEMANDTAQGVVGGCIYLGK